MHTQSYPEWFAAMQAKGCLVEPDGGEQIVAHIDGVPHGYWDPKYAGVGIGVVYAKV